MAAKAALDLLGKNCFDRTSPSFGVTIAGEGGRTCGDGPPGGHQDFEQTQDQVHGHGRERCLQESLHVLMTHRSLLEAAVDRRSATAA